MMNLKASEINYQENKIFIFVLLIILLLYISFPTKNFYWDGVFFSQAVEDAGHLSAGLFHPNHLFYNVIGYLGYESFKTIDLPIRAIFVFQYLSIASGLLSALVLFKILKGALHSTYLSLTLTVIFAFSATWWKFATDADAYIPSIFFLLVSFYLILPDKKPRPLLVALTHACAMFFHELAVFFFPVVVLGIIFQTVNMEKIKTRFLIIFKYAAGVFLLTFVTYCICFYLQNKVFDIPGFVRWITFYTTENGFSQQEVSNLQLSLRGNRQLFFNGSAGFRPRDVSNIFLLIIFAASVIIFLIQFGRNFRDIKIVWEKLRESKAFFQPVSLLCLLWMAPYLFFLFYFIPSNTFYRLFYFPALIILAGNWLAPFELANPVRRWRLAVFALIIGLSNFLFFIRPQSQIRDNTPLALATQANNIWTAKTVVYFDLLDTDNRIVRYFTPATVWKPIDSVSPEEFKDTIKAVYQSGGTVWLESSAIQKFSQSPETARLLTENTFKDSTLELNTAAANVKYVQIAPPAEK